MIKEETLEHQEQERTKKRVKHDQHISEESLSKFSLTSEFI